MWYNPRLLVKCLFAGWLAVVGGFWLSVDEICCTRNLLETDFVASSFSRQSFSALSPQQPITTISWNAHFSYYLWLLDGRGSVCLHGHNQISPRWCCSYVIITVLVQDQRCNWPITLAEQLALAKKLTVKNFLTWLISIWLTANLTWWNIYYTPLMTLYTRSPFKCILSVVSVQSGFI